MSLVQRDRAGVFALKLWRPLAVAAWSGALLGLSVFPTDRVPLGHWPVFFGFVPLWNHWLGAAEPREVFRTGWLAQFVLTLFAFNWLAHTVHEYAFLPWPLAVLVLAGFGALANLHVPLAGWIAHRLFPADRYGEGSRILGLVLLTAAGERLYPMLFAWNFGYVWFYEKWPGFHFADVIGFQGLSSAGIAVNGLVLWAWRRKRAGGRWWLPLALASLFLFALNAAGLYRLARLPSPDRVFHALLVQANIGNRQKHEAEYGGKFREVIIAKYVSLTERALAENADRPAPDIVVWPENAYPNLILDPSLARPEERPLRDLVTRHEIALVTGGYGFDGVSAVNNTVFLLSPRGLWAGPPYRKTILLPFGEYVPGSRRLPALKKILPHVRDYAPGYGPQVNNFGELKLGLEICYEGLFDWFARRLAAQGAGVIVNVTNDSWYGTWQQPYQHFYMTLGRAVETRLPLVRATNTGISGVALASGEILEPSPLHREWTRLYEIPYVGDPGLTPFVRYGYRIVPWILGLALAFLVVLPRVRAVRLSG